MRIETTDAAFVRLSLTYPHPKHDYERAHNTAVLVDAHTPISLIVRAIAAVIPQADPYVDEHILDPLLRAGAEALNLERGHLDGGRCSEWLESIAELRGIDL